VRVPARVVGPAQLAAGAGSVWVAYQGLPAVLRIDPSTPGRIAATVNLHAASGGGVSFADGHAWASVIGFRYGNLTRGAVAEIDPRTDRVTGSVSVGTGPAQLASGFGSVWVNNTADPYPSMSRIDLRTDRSTALPFAGQPAVGFGSLWAAQVRSGAASGRILRYDPATGRVEARIPVANGAAIAFGQGRVWVATGPRSRSSGRFAPIKDTATLTEIDPRTDRVVGTPTRLPVVQPMAIAVAGHNLWVADYASGTLLHFRLTG
jgi:DNA-binding beta-propeller fold protein YncE